jgi:pyruvate ferredoxin oxidoreductase gamma subunit
MGAPVVAFCRIDDHEIRSREPITQPDAIIIQDPTLLHSVDVFGGLNPDGYILINTTRDFESLGIDGYTAGLPEGHARTVGATEIAMTHVGRPIPNAALLGGFAAETGEISLDSVTAAIEERFPGSMGEKNVAAASTAYEAISAAERGDHHV